MEALRSDTVHASDSMRSLSCINTHHIDELSKEKEEELLYGAGDDGDEEDALSDDSMRLRLSDDDEIEAENVLTPVLDDQERKSKNNITEMTSGKDDDVQTSVPEKNVIENNTTAGDINQEEHCSGNVSKDEEIIIDHGKHAKRIENGLLRPPITNMPRPWTNCDPQWRFARNPGGRSFHNANHPSYNRYRYLTPRGHYRLQSFDYNTRFRNAFFPIERGRGNGMFNSYNRSYGNRQQNKGFKCTTTPKLNNSTELDQNPTSISNTSISPNTEVNNDTKNTKVNNKKIVEKDNTLSSDTLVNSDKSNDQSSKLSNEKVENVTIENVQKENVVDANSVSDSLKLHHNSKENSEVTYNDDTKCKSITPSKINISNEDSSEEFVDYTINCLNNDNKTDKISENSINNAVESSDFYICDNSKEVEALDIDVKCKPNKDDAVKYTEKDSISNEKKDEVVETVDIDTSEVKNDKELHKLEQQELNANQQSAERDQETKLSKSYCKTLDISKGQKIVNNELTVNRTVTDHKIEEISRTDEGEVPLETMHSKEDDKDIVPKATDTVSSDLTVTKDDEEIRIIQTNTPVINDEKCESNQLKSSDNSTNSTKISKVIDPEDQLTHAKINPQEQSKVSTEKSIKPTEKENSVISSPNKTAKPNVNIKLALNENNTSDINLQNGSLGFVTDGKTNSESNDKNAIDIPVTTQRRRRRTKKMIIAAQEAASEEYKQVRESGRQKRRTAKNAEEIIRKKFLNHDSDLESSDDSEKFVVVNHKMNQNVCPLSPPSLKRNYSDSGSTILNGIVKKPKINSEAVANELPTKESNSENLKKLSYVHKFFQRDCKEKLPKLKQEELEELLIQKIVETITMRAEIGKLREQARISERNQEVTRAKCQQLAKQIKDFEMVLSRNAADRRANNDKPTPPIKINRSVGLQVNFITDHGMQNLRQLQQNSNIKSLQVSSSSNTLNTSNNETNNASSPRKGIKIRSPRRTESISGQSPVISQNHTQSPNITSTITPAALVVAKPVDTQHTLTLSNQPNVQQIMPNQQPQPQQSQQAIVLNGKFPNQINRQGSTTITVAKSRANDLIDLTDEEEKSKATVVPVVTTTITDQQVNLAQKTQPCFQRVIQTIPGNVAITSQPPSIRVVQPASQPTPTALVNNMNAPRLAYVMQSGVGPTRQLLITPSSNPMRPVTSCRASFPTLTYKAGISTIANGTVRVLTTPATSNVQLNKHPAPLPDTRSYTVNPLLKLPPPAPSLKISKVAHGIVLSWNMNLSDKYADIASYQLYAYQEVAGVPPNTSLWKKVGDVRALPLPMACTLTQFSEGNNYYFAVRAVDTHSRKGQYSIPGNISL